MTLIKKAKNLLLKEILLKDMNTSTHDYYYELPEELIAQTPLEPRDSSRLMVYDMTNDVTEHRHFRDITDYLYAGDVLVVNNTRVLPVRLYGKKEKTGGKIEFLLLKRLGMDEWEVALRPGKYAAPGVRFVFGDKLKAEITGVTEGGTRTARFENDGSFESILEEIGQMPLPHYIKTPVSDGSRYNTVYSKINGSAAAPTAGLHFTEALLDKIRAKGVVICNVLLHVGLGTFRPVKTEDITQHKMHSEYYEVTPEAADIINKAKEEGRRIVAVGTTSVRVLESATVNGKLVPGCGDTSIFIYPPYKFKSVDALITNFHLPESTLIMLVSAFAGREKTLELYKEAVRLKYRFFSFGDAMFITDRIPNKEKVDK